MGCKDKSPIHFIAEKFNLLALFIKKRSLLPRLIYEKSPPFIVHMKQTIMSPFKGYSA